jgi:hypothetical protein
MYQDAILKLNNKYTKTKTMKNFLITYWAERNDEPTDIETIIQADTLTEALERFQSKTLYYKYIESIKMIIK